MANNGVGVASVCWNCLLMPLRISDTTGYATYSTAATAITWAADHGARVLNLSYSMSASGTVQSAAQYFWNHGGVSTLSSGNSGTFVSASDSPYIVTVGAVDPSNVLYSWSNTGNNVDLVAPGCVNATTLRGGGYGSGCGTSYSAPIAAGVAALVMSANPGLTAAEVITVLLQNATDLGAAGWDIVYGAGLVNAATAVQAAGGSSFDTTAPSVSISNPVSGSSVSGIVSANASAWDNVAVSSVTIAVDGLALCTATVAPYSCSWNTAAQANGSHTVTATARDAAGNSKTVAETVNVNNNINDTTPPTTLITAPLPGATASKNLTVEVSAMDNVGVVSVELYLDGSLTGTDTSGPYTFKVNFQRLAPGAHTLQARARDATGNAGVSPPVTVYK